MKKVLVAMIIMVVMVVMMVSAYADGSKLYYYATDNCNATEKLDSWIRMYEQNRKWNAYDSESKTYFAKFSVYALDEDGNNVDISYDIFSEYVNESVKEEYGDRVVFEIKKIGEHFGYEICRITAESDYLPVVTAWEDTKDGYKEMEYFKTEAFIILDKAL